MQEKTRKLEENARIVGLKINAKKTKLMYLRLGNIWKTTTFSKKTKLKLYNSCALSVLLYGSEYWRMTDNDINRLSSFHNTSLRKIMNIFWPSKISNKDQHNITNTNDMQHAHSRTVVRVSRRIKVMHV